MNRIERIIMTVRNEEGGFTLPFVAIMLVLLLGLSAFAVDLGWFYLNGGRLQRAADSSALAGVVFLPHDVANVENKAIEGANANGYDVGTVNGTSIGSGPDSMAWSELQDNKLQVSLTSTIDTFFLKVLGIEELTMTRKATAQFIKPVPLGAPANCMGIGPGVTTDGLQGDTSAAVSKCASYTQNFWSAINGRRTSKEQGDPYGPTCGYQCSGSNPDHDQYYYFAVDVPENPGNWVDVWLYDAGFYDRYPHFSETGDDDDISYTASGGTHMNYSLFLPDTTPGIPEDNLTPATCSIGTNSLTVNSGNDASTYKNRWAGLCRINNPVEGIYVLRVSNGGSTIGGNNSYALFLNADNFDSSDPPRVYSINEMSIFTNDDDGHAIVYIAEVDPIHANKTLELTFYDPGEGAGNAQMTVLPPPGVTGHSCSWVATDVWPGGGPDSGSSCTINSTVSGNAMYNGEWITMQIDLPADYTCSSDCFWKMDLDLNVSHDRTTWKARVIGNPVALVPNP